MPNRLFFLLIFAPLLGFNCKKEKGKAAAAKLQINIQHLIDGSVLERNKTYTNHFGESFTISKLKYYISNLVLVKNNSRVSIPDTYYLIDDSLAASKNIQVSIPVDSYSGISFLLGVDSLHNVSGAQAGALDPVHEMLWSWSTGYIMAKLEGKSAASTAPNQMIEYHIGGFKGSNNVLRTVNVNFNSLLPVNDKQSLTIGLDAELQKWFKGLHSLSIANHPVSVSPGPLSAQFADNYARMFTLTSVKAQ